MTCTLPIEITDRLLSSTSGQWWRCDALGFGGERRVELVASYLGHHLWTASFRNERTRQHFGQRFFVTLPGQSAVLAVFDSLADRDAWLKANWQGA